MENIEFKPIPGFAGYEVSYCGKVKVVDKIYQRTKNGKYHDCLKKGNFPKTHLNDKKYLMVCLFGNSYRIHRLVALAWIPNPNNYDMVLHKDDNPSNPHGDNLFWGNNTINMQDCSKKGRIKIPIHYGLDNVNGKLSKIQVKNIRKKRLAGALLKDMAKKYKVNGSTISAICLNKTHRES